MTHTVFFWLSPDLTDTETATFETEAKKLLTIDVIQRGSVGKTAPTPERPVTDKTFSYSLHLEFASIADHNIYQDHADHHAFVDACKHMWTKAIVYDAESI